MNESDAYDLTDQLTRSMIAFYEKLKTLPEKDAHRVLDEMIKKLEGSLHSSEVKSA